MVSRDVAAQFALRLNHVRRFQEVSLVDYTCGTAGRARLHEYGASPGPAVFAHSDQCRHLTIRVSLTLNFMRFMVEEATAPFPHSMRYQIITAWPCRTILETATVCISVINSFANLLTVNIRIEQTGKDMLSQPPNWNGNTTTVPDPRVYEAWKIHAKVKELLRVCLNASEEKFADGREIDFVVGKNSKPGTAVQGIGVESATQALESESVDGGES